MISIILAFLLSFSSDTDNPVSAKGYDIFISSRNTGTVKRFDAETGEYKGEFGGEEIVEEVQEVTIGPDGMLYVSGLKNKTILKFNPTNGEFIEHFTSGYELESPTKITFHNDGFLYVSQWGDSQSSVVRFDAKTGKFDKDFTGKLSGPLGHAWDAKGNLYVACFYSTDIQVFDPNGKLKQTIKVENIMRGPSNPWFDKSQNLRVADWETGRIIQMKKVGGQYQFDSIIADSFTKLEGITEGPDAYLYACDWWQNVIRKLDKTTGEDLGVVLSGGEMLRPNGICFWKRT